MKVSGQVPTSSEKKSNLEIELKQNKTASVIHDTIDVSRLNEQIYPQQAVHFGHCWSLGL